MAIGGACAALVALSACGRDTDAPPAVTAGEGAATTTPVPPQPGAEATLENARALLDRGRYAAAESVGLALLHARTVRRDSLATALLLDTIVEAARRGGRSRAPETRARAERAVRLKEQRLGSRDPEVARSIANLAIVVEESGDFAAARPLYERALAIRIDAFGAEHPDVAASLNDLGILLTQTADYDAARQALERALAIREHTFGPNHLDVAQSLNALAHLYGLCDDFAAARQAYDRVLAIRIAVRGPDHVDVAGALNNLATLLLGIGEFDESQRLLERALAIREKVLGPEHRAVASTLSNLALVQRRKREFAAARPLFERAIAILQTTSGATHPTLATALSGYGSMLIEAGDFAAADRELQRALAIRENALGPHHPQVAASLQDLALLRREQGDLGGAIRLLERCVRIREDAFDRDDPGVARPLRELAAACALSGDSKRGFEAAIRAEDLAREHQRLAARTLSEHDALRYGTIRAHGLDLAVGFALAGGTDAMRQRAWDALIRARGLVLDEIAARARWVSDTDDAETARLASALAVNRTRLADLQVRGAGALAIGDYRALVEQATRDKNDVERALAARSARFREAQGRSRVGLAEVTTRLAPDDVLVAYTLYERLPPGGRSYVAFVLRGHDRTVRAIDLGPATTIEALAARWTREVTRGPRVPGRTPAQAETACNAVGTELRQRIWDPLDLDASYARRIFIVPDGVLQVINPAALPAPGAGYLVEQASLLHILASERDLVPGIETRASNQGLLAVGGPAFDAPAQVAAAAGAVSAAAPIVAAHATRGGFELATALESVQFRPLPAAGRETDAILQVWRRAHSADAGERDASRACTGRDATETAFKRLAPGKRVLHLATHGYFLGPEGAVASATSRGMGTTGAAAKAAPSVDPVASAGAMLRSGLALAGANDRARVAPGADDGILTAEEITCLDLQGVEWAVLSACDTGLGEVQSREGVFGLRRAFQMAGVRTLLISLWAVDDELSLRWMNALYSARFERRMGTAEAVRRANLETLGEQRAGGHSGHPYYWAGFVAAGDWR